MHPLEEKTVLVVEDEVGLRELFRSALTVGGYNVVAVEDGIHALHWIEEHRPPDCIVLDLMLPRLHGRDVAQELRDDARTHRVPIVIVTGTDARDLRDGDFEFLLRKPIEPDSLVATVDGCINRSRGTSTGRGRP